MRNFTSSTKGKLTLDLLYVQIQWAAWIFPIIFIVYIALNRFSPETPSQFTTYMSSIVSSSRVFMLIFGILSCFSFLPYFVNLGVTRKDYFAGTAISSVLLAIVITTFSALITFLIQLTGLIKGSSTRASLDFLDSSSVWLVPILVACLLILSYFIAGWIISIGFYRSGFLGKVGSILLAFMFLSLTNLLWEGDLSLPLISRFNIPFPAISTPTSMLISATLICLGFWYVYCNVKKVPIKLK